MRRTIFPALMIVLLSALISGEVSADYMDAQLRTKVEALKSDYAATPTTTATYAARANVAWLWLNAYAMTGNPVPVNITSAIRPSIGDDITSRGVQQFDYFLDDLIFLDEQPNALGDLSADLGPFEARTFVSLTQRYRVGEREMAPGSGFVIGHHFMPGYGVFQTSDPAGDNYVSIQSTNASVVFARDAVPINGMHGGFRGAVPQVAFRVKEGTLKPGDVVNIVCGDKSGGSRGFLMSPASTDFLPVPIYVLFAGSDHQYGLPIQPISVSGTDIASVHGFSPSVVRPNEKFELSVRAEDRYYNRPKGLKPGFIVKANGAPMAEVPASRDAITVLKDLSFHEPGVYRISIESTDGTVSGVGNPILVSDDARKVYWGDTHGHSGFAEGIGTPDRFMQWAKDDARLDFVTHSEHDIWLDDHEWQVLLANVEKFSEPGRFVAFPGYEWTTRNIYGGHHNVLFRDAKNRDRVPTQFFPTPSSLYTGLHARYPDDDVLIIPHAHQAGDYRQNDPQLERLVEIMSHHGTFEWFGRMYLNHGHQVGFIAASDDHMSQPGYTGFWAGYMSQRGGLAAVRADSNSRDDIFDAMRSLKTYATTGDRIILDVTLNDAEMGSRAPFAKDRVIKGRVIGTAPIQEVTVIKNDETLWHKSYLTQESGRYRDEETFYVTFESPSYPMNAGDNPRGTRGWLGTLKVAGAELTDFSATDFLNPDVNRLERDEADPSILHFVTGSRGDASSIVLRLRNIKKSAKIELKLEPAMESGSPTIYRPSKRTPASHIQLAFKDLDQGVTTSSLSFDGYDDRVTLRRHIVNGSDDVEFEIEDSGMLQGDYYFVRVKQANDAMAWSSPIWVGGYPSR